MPAQTGLAASTWCSWLEGNAIADCEGLDCGSDLDDGTCGLVAEDHGLFEDEGADATVLPVVDVGATNAGVVDCYKNIVFGGESGLWLLGEGYVEGLVEDERKVLWVSVLGFGVHGGVATSVVSAILGAGMFKWLIAYVFVFVVELQDACKIVNEKRREGWQEKNSC